MQEDLQGNEPTLSAEAGLTEGAAKAAGQHGFSDAKLHAGFISKQTPLPTGEGLGSPASQGATPPPAPAGPLDLEPAENGQPALSGEAGLTEGSAKAAGSRGYADPALHAGFISKQTPLPEEGA